MGQTGKRSKKRSAASSPAQPEPVFFVDRSIGRVRVPAALRAAGAKVIHHDERFPQDAPDIEWLAEAGRSEWVVVSADKHIRHRPNERRALMAAGVLALVVTSPNLTGAELGNLLVRALPRLKHLAANAPRPAIYLLPRDGRPVRAKGE